MERTWKLRIGTLATVLVALLAAGCASNTQTDTTSNLSKDTIATPAAQTPATAAATAESKPLTLVGKFALNPAHGPWGTNVSARATGLAPSATYELVWLTVTGSWQLTNQDTEYVGRDYKPAEQVLAKVSTDAQGAFQAAFTVPEDFGFQHDVVVRQDGSIRNKSGFDVDMQVSISPSSGPVGTPITVEAKGIGWRQMENSWLVSYDGKFTGWISAVTTKGYAKAIIPAAGGPGTHVVTVLHGDFTFPYLNMQQSPEPNRPQFHIPFRVTDGPAVLPPDIATQVLPAKASGGPPADGIALWTEQATGIVGSQTAVKARGLPANTEVELTWSTVVGNRVSGSGWEEQTKTLAQVRTDKAGVLNWTLNVPDDLGGVHIIGAKVGDNVLAKNDFIIQPSAQKLSVERGPAGSETMIQLNGVGWTETANIYNIVVDNAYAGYACGFNSGGNVQIFTRMVGAPGWHFIELYPGVYKGKETRPQNFKIPQLTSDAEHPGERLPVFRFAFYVTPD